MTRLFVYGTLKTGLHNHSYLSDARFLGNHLTAAIFSMYDFGGYPAVCRQGQIAVSGEVYQISAQQLSAIDELEWYPDLYQRLRIETSYGEAWMYIVEQELCISKPQLSGIWV